MHKYVMLYRRNDSENIDCEYVSLGYALKVLKKYRVYIFRYKKSEDILYINYPLNIYYSSTKINDLENNSEDNISSFGHIEVRLLDNYPSIKFAVNMGDL